jgi:hypothetical protein
LLLTDGVQGRKRGIQREAEGETQQGRKAGRKKKITLVTISYVYFILPENMWNSP